MLIDQVAIHFAASKNREYRQRVLDRFTVLLDVLNSQGWLRSGVADRFSSEREGFELRSEDLTPDGMSFIRANYDSWLRSLDRKFAGDYSEGARKRLEQRTASHNEQAEQAGAQNP